MMLLENNPYPEDVRVRQEAESLLAAGHRVTVLAPAAAGQPRRERVDGVIVRRFWLPESSGSAAGFVLEYAVAHLQLILRGLYEVVRGADVVHMHNPPDTLFPVGLVARALGRSVVFDHHDLFPELLGEKLGSGALVSIARLAQRASLRSATAVLVTNRSQAEAVLAGGLRDAGALTVVRNGPKRATLAGASSARRGVLDDPRLVFVGELDSQDGVLALPELLAGPGMQRARLTVVGDGALRQELVRRCAASGISGRVTFTGRVDHDRVPELIAGADVCVDPAPGTELNHRSTMIKVTEYLAAGRPVVAFDLRETRRTAQGAALYAPCDDLARFGLLIMQLAQDACLREEIARRAEQRAEELVWEHAEEALIDAYDRL